EGPPAALLLLTCLDALVGVAFGWLASAFARTEFQAVQFMPMFIGPQLFLCGLLVPKENMPAVLGAIADWLPMTWAVDAVLDIVANSQLSGGTWLRCGLLRGLALVLLLVASASSARRTPCASDPVCLADCVQVGHKRSAPRGFIERCTALNGAKARR